MTTPDLPALLSRLRAATGPDRDIDREIEHLVCGVERPPEGCQLAYPTPYTKSIYAADLLITRLGFAWGKTLEGLVYVSDPEKVVAQVSTGATLPIAFCIGAVRQVMARAGATDDGGRG